jgi:hypothetical protein
MTPTHTRKRGRLYRYYVATNVIKTGPDACPIGRVPAAAIETAVIDQFRELVQTPGIIVATWRAAKKATESISETEIRSALISFDELWAELFPAEQARIVQLLVERIDVRTDGIAIRLNIAGLVSLVAELKIANQMEIAA